LIGPTKIDKLTGEMRCNTSNPEICSMKTRYILLGIAILVCTATPVLAKLQAGDKAPDFNARTMEDTTAKLSDLKGKTLLVEMGTTWCPSCNELAHQINGLRDYLKEKGITYVSVYVADSADSILEHEKDEKLKAADVTLIDDGEARRSYSVFSIPRLLLIDENFNIVFDEMVLTGKQIRQRIEEMYPAK
jgi:peroxiredoxin